MATLTQLQADFRDYLISGGEGLASHVAVQPDVDGDARMAVYFNAYRARLIEALQETYEKTWAYLGDEHFANACAAAIAARSPSSWTLRDYGGHLPDVLQGLWEAAPEVSELARLDWAMRHCFDGPEAQPANAAELAKAAGDRWVDMHIGLHPTLSWLPVRWNVAAIWAAIDQGRPPPPATALDEPRWVKIWRRDLRPHYQTVDHVEAQGLALLSSGVSFGALCEHLTSRLGQDEGTLRAGALLRSWLEEDLIVACVWNGEKFQVS
jgi:hypothetical protein